MARPAHSEAGRTRSTRLRQDGKTRRASRFRALYVSGSDQSGSEKGHCAHEEPGRTHYAVRRAGGAVSTTAGPAPVSPKFLENRLATVALEVEAELEMRTVFTRDLDAGFARVLAPHSLVVMATKKRWWPTAEVKLTRLLVRAGHSVVLLEV